MIVNRKWTAASILSGVAVAAVGLVGHSLLSQESNDVSPAQALGTEPATLQVETDEINLGKHWGN